MVAQRRATQDRRIEIADAALRIIATRGIAELSTKSVAEAVGLTTGAIFRHYESMDALLEGVVDRVDEVLRATYPPADLPPVERLERFVDARLAAVGERSGILRLVLSEQFSLALPEGAAAKLRGAVSETRAFLVATIAEGQRAGELRADIPAELLAMTVMGTMQMLAFAAAMGVERAGQGGGVRGVMLRLLTAQDAARKPRRRS